MSTPPTPTTTTPCDARMMAATAVAVSRESRRAAELEEQRALMLGRRRGERVTIRVGGTVYSGAAEILYVQPEEERPMAAYDDHRGEKKTAREPINLAGESKQAAEQRQRRAIELRLAREALAGPLGYYEREKIRARIAELEGQQPANAAPASGRLDDLAG